MLRARVVTGLLLAAGLIGLAYGATITVDSTADSQAVDGNCGLREAILAANGDSAVDACVAGAGADVVVVPAGTYVLGLVGPGEDAAATGDLDVTAELDISGAGAGTTIVDGGAIGDRVLDIDPAGAGLTVSISGLTIQNGHEINGGGVRSRGQLTVSD